MSGVEIAFPGVKALDGVGLRLFAGEVHSLMGENGAGKSTLIKALTGVYDIDAGTIVVEGVDRHFATPSAAQDAGISTVYQEVNLCANLTVAENIMLGREPRRFGRIDFKSMNRRAAALLERLDLDIDPRSVLAEHPIAVQQLVSIARALEVDARVLILDEPTSSLDADEVAQLFVVIRRLRDAGVAVVFVSHFLDQVFDISDRLTVLRNGTFVGEYLTRDITPVGLVSKMLGRELDALTDLDDESRAPASAVPGAEPVVRAVGIGRKGVIEPIDLDLFEGEVVGVAGLLGSGRTELARLLFGADRSDEGSIEVRGRLTKLRTPRAAIGQDIAFCSENRRSEGVVGDLSVRDNLVLALQASRGWLRPIPQKTKDALVARYVEALDIRPANPDALLRNLSGGNQQKVLLARWLITQPKVMILDEPTRGIDIGAKTQIQKLVSELARDGMSVVFISAELEEVLRISDRVVVMRDRRKISDRRNVDTSVADLMETIAAGSSEPDGTRRDGAGLTGTDGGPTDA
ncbi:sugar ABC transporter ATP-binding protein [Aeromicrobium fastidiosum]|uniref:Sugar ABC transporter ATP-binding protein n=2 Tax=Aeromicrobium fastidiosum TaxID=52699 RepID=A0A641ATT9_9ACTN|nr:sugar ABC transporter ATP-binding protein [Aeromicrobium fastidiosum]